MGRARGVALLGCVLVFGTGEVAAQGTYRLNKYDIGGTGDPEYIVVESVKGNVFITRGTHVTVVDGTGKAVGDIPKMAGARSVQPISREIDGFTANAGDSTLTLFDLKMFLALKTIPIKRGALVGLTFDDSSNRVIAASRGSPSTAVAVDARTTQIVGSVEIADPVAARGASDGKGKVYLLGTGGAIQVIDGSAMKAVATWPLAPCEEPTAIDYDRATDRIFAGCKKTSVIVDARSGRVIANIPGGDGVTGLAWDGAEKRLYLAAGDDGKVTIVRQTAAGYAIDGTVSVVRGARSIAVDSLKHTAYLAHPDTGPAGTPTTWLFSIVH